MQDGLRKVGDDYDQKYRTHNYFHYRSWLFGPFVRAMVLKAKLKPGQNVLDVGCGQGLFSSFFGGMGLHTLGIDISPEGIRSASATYGSPHTRFEVADVRSIDFDTQFDCVFVRACSLYNTTDLESARETTTRLLGMVKGGGVLIFDYYTNLCSKKSSATWMYHSMSGIRRHFTEYWGSRTYFSLRIDTLFAGRFAFSGLFSAVGAFLSSTLGIGGDVVVFVRKT
jgi:ubiquinone/menaquinone biosynthesis C-methylase UbiE